MNMCPTLATLNIGDGAFRYTEALTDLGPGNARANQAPNLAHGLGVNNGGRGMPKANSGSVFVVLAIRGPFQVAKAVIGLVAIYVIHLGLIQRVRNKGLSHEPVDLAID